MGVDWGQAWQVGVVGFLLVFSVLTILALSMWAIGWFFKKLEAMKNRTQPEQENPDIMEETEEEPALGFFDSERYE